jgi:hypothetical protein
MKSSGPSPSRSPRRRANAERPKSLIFSREQAVWAVVSLWRGTRCGHLRSLISSERRCSRHCGFDSLPLRFDSTPPRESEM